MNNFTKLFSFVVVFIQIQIALSQPIKSPTGSDLIHQLCNFNIYPGLCISTLNLDPRSKTSNIRGLALISIDATSKKVNEFLEYLISASKTIKDRELLKRYETCIKEYGMAVYRFLPAALVDMKANNYLHAMGDMKNVVLAADNCEAQFAGKLTLIGRNKAVHDIADMTADIIRYLFGN